MEFESTGLSVVRKQNIPDEIWNQFLCKFPLCSKQYKLPADTLEQKYKFLSALMIANIFDILISWQQLTKLEYILQTFQQIVDDQTQQPHIKNQFHHLINHFKVLLDELKPFDFKEINSNQLPTEKIQIAQGYLQNKRKKIYNYLEHEGGINTLFQLSRGMALSFYLKSDSQVPISNTTQIDQLSNKEIIERLSQFSNDAFVKNNLQNHFILEDYVVIAISHLLNYPIHFFINDFDTKNNDLKQRKIHQEENQDKVVSFLLDTFDNNINVRILASNQDILYTQNIINKKQQQESIVKSILQIIENILNQVMEDFCNFNKLWILKIFQVINHGETSTLIANKHDINNNQQFIQYSLELFQQLNFDYTVQQEFVKNFQQNLEKKEQVVENIIISQVKMIREKIQEIINDNRQLQKLYESEPQLKRKQHFAVQLTPKEIDNDVPQNDDFDLFPQPDNKEQFTQQQIDNQNLPSKNEVGGIICPKKQNYSRSEIVNLKNDTFFKPQKKSESIIVKEMLSFKTGSLLFSQTTTSRKAQSEIKYSSRIEKDNLQFIPKLIKKGENNKNSKIFNQSYISETFNEQSSVIYMKQTFLCTICYKEFNQADEIRTLHDDHKLCRSCLGDWIKVKFNSSQWNFKYFKCPMQIKEGETLKSCEYTVDQQEIKKALTTEEFDILINNAMKHEIVDIICPNQACQANIKGIPPEDENELLCPKCSIKICCVCKQIDHGDSECPQRLEEIKLALEDERVGCCPRCLEIYMKNEGCQHVSCINCLTEFCFACSADRIPIAAHGAHYHRVGCISRCPWYQDNNKNIENLDEEYSPDDCEYCKKHQKGCPRPISLLDFRNLAHLKFNNNQK